MLDTDVKSEKLKTWLPACAGMTEKRFFTSFRMTTSACGGQDGKDLKFKI
jgi:hypothetical protein